MSLKTVQPERVMEPATTGFSAQALERLSNIKGEPGWVLNLRRRAWQIYMQLPFPTGKEEEWRRTSLRGLKIDAVNPFPAQRTAIQSKQMPPDATRHLRPLETATGTLVIQDGTPVFAHEQAELAATGVIFKPLDVACRENPDLVQKYLGTAVAASENKFVALESAFWTSGVFLYVPKGVNLALPLQTLFSMVPDGSCITHTLIVMDEGSSAAYLEDLVSPQGSSAQGFADQTVELILRPGSKLTFAQVQNWGENIWNFGTQRAKVDRDAEVRWVNGTLGSRLTKYFVRLALAGQGSAGEVLGLRFLHGRQHIDLDTHQDHIAPNTTSDLLFKGVATDRARSVWRGMIHARPAAQKTNGYQKDMNLLLSPHARADSIPGLEIEANDLRCTHGSTASQIDPEHLFYLMARGLRKADAETLIVRGFFEGVLSRIAVESVREKLEREIEVRITGETLST